MSQNVNFGIESDVHDGGDKVDLRFRFELRAVREERALGQRNG
jgi:hypothetical protein